MSQTLPEIAAQGGSRRGACLWLLLSLLGLLALGSCKNGDTTPEKSPIPGRPPPVKGSAPKGGGWKCGDKLCNFEMGEDCMVCSKDCGKCDGCQRKVGEGCTDCKCEACVCKKYPSCCKRGRGWSRKCVTACKKDCGGCGLGKGRRPPRNPGAGKGSGTKGQPPTGAGGRNAWKCGDGKCFTNSGEDCRICPKDCGNCDGCQVKVGGGCTDCKCAKCVCKKLPGCCGKKGTWSAKCVAACKKDCGGCGISKQVSAPPSAGTAGTKPRPTNLTAKCGNNRCELALGEDCEVCPKDCSRCNGCLPKLGPGCRNCKCAECVCKKMPQCCKAKGRWSIRCVEACREKCGGCGVTSTAPSNTPGKVSPTPAKVGAAAAASSAASTCGDGKCNSGTEDCILCSRDCGNCDGCQAKLGPGCLLCKCGKCVCKKRPSCCKAGGKWDATCAALCKKECGGCGLLRSR